MQQKATGIRIRCLVRDKVAAFSYFAMLNRYSRHVKSMEILRFDHVLESGASCVIAAACNNLSFFCGGQKHIFVVDSPTRRHNVD